MAGVRGHCHRIPVGHLPSVWISHKSTRFVINLFCFIIESSQCLSEVLHYANPNSGTKHIRDARKTDAEKEREEKKRNDTRPLKEKLLDFPRALFILVCENTFT